jgi:IclR family pca regulon transcriptional regulator
MAARDNTAGQDDRGEHFLESLERAMRVLRAFDAETPERTLTDVADATGMSRATARRILLTFVDLGYVILRGRAFTLSPRVLEFGFSYLANLGLTGVAQPHMTELSRQIGEVVLLAVLDGHDVRYIARADAPRILNLSVPVGARSPAHVTSAGRMLVASSPPAEVDAYLRTADIRRYTDWTVTDTEQLRSQLEEAADRGWAHSISELDVGMEGVAVLVPGARSGVALSSLFPVTRFEPRELVDSVVTPLQEYAVRIANDAHLL